MRLLHEQLCRFAIASDEKHQLCTTDILMTGKFTWCGALHYLIHIGEIIGRHTEPARSHLLDLSARSYIFLLERSAFPLPSPVLHNLPPTWSVEMEPYDMARDGEVEDLVAT